MKATTVFAIAALTLGGAACSETANTEAVEVAETVTAEEPQEAESAFNLNLGIEDDEADSGFNLSLGTEDDSTGLIGENVLEASDLGTDVPTIEVPKDATKIDTKIETPVEDDGVIRLDPK